ncbi:hypothetical protein MMC18_000091 [Xylographa bjoerkii]|nr:hypothetical protein [Xylographa bjoerkii]
MFFAKSVLVAVGLLLTLTSAFKHAKGVANGIYRHHIDAAGKEVTEYLGVGPPANSTPLKAPNQGQSGKVHARDSTPPGSTSCAENVLDPVDLVIAQNAMASWCGIESQFDSAVSKVQDTVVAYVCAYSGKKPGTNQCDEESAVGYYGLIGANCHATRAGWYMIPHWGLSYGRDLQPTAFELSVHDPALVFRTPMLNSSVYEFLEAQHIKDRSGEKYQRNHSLADDSTKEIVSTLLLHVSAAADYYSRDTTLMRDGLLVDLDIILDPYLLNIFPQSLVPTAIYLIVLAVLSWAVSGFVWQWLGLLAQPDGEDLQDQAGRSRKKQN